MNPIQLKEGVKEATVFRINRKNQPPIFRLCWKQDMLWKRETHASAEQACEQGHRALLVPAGH